MTVPGLLRSQDVGSGNNIGNTGEDNTDTGRKSSDHSPSQVVVVKDGRKEDQEEEGAASHI